MVLGEQNILRLEKGWGMGELEEKRELWRPRVEGVKGRSFNMF